MKVLLASLASLSLLLSAGCSAIESTTEAAAPPAKVLKVKIGESASTAKKARSHNITESRLKNGQTEYEVKNSNQSFKIELSEDQIKDILGGTTIMVNTLEGGMKVQVTASEKKKKKKSGW